MDAQKLTDAEIDLIANDGMRNAAGGIYSTRVHEFARSVEAAVRDTLQAELASMTRMFHAACADLGSINEALGLDPEDGGAEPIIGAIEDLKAQIAAPVAPAAAPSEWQPIETAPKTGRTLLLGYLNSAGKWRTVRGQWMSANYIEAHWEDPDDVEPGWFETSAEADDVPNCWGIEPTHWMPLPAAPQGAAQ